MQEFRTPFDGQVSIGPAGGRKLGYELTIRNRSGKTLRSSRQGVSRATASTTRSAASRACASRSALGDGPAPASAFTR